MELRIRKIKINDIQFSNDIKIVNNILYIKKQELIKIVKEDNRLKSVEINIARPDESVRIVPVKDVIEPRAKLEKEAFPGIDGKIEEVGRGISYVLKGCSVITTGPIVGFQEGVIDMKGPLSDYTPFSKTNNIVLNITKKEDIGHYEHEEAIRKAGIRIAHYITKKVLSCEYDEEEKIDWDNIATKSKKYPELPRIVYVYLCMSQGLLHDTYFYGLDSKRIIPTLISPLEVMDGALISGNCVSPGSKTTTFHHQNNAVIKELFKRDGKEINFIGTILSPLMITLDDKYRNVNLAARLVEMIGADGVVISQEGFGNPTTDLMMLCQKIENKGIKTVLISNEDAGEDGKSESLPDGVEEADAIISTGNSNATIKLPPMEKVYGNLSAVEKITGGFVGSIQSNGGLIIEIHSIIGSHNLQGYSNLSSVTI